MTYSPLEPLSPHREQPLDATFAGYTILRLLGSGAMGEVYLAEHPRLPRQDALKILRTDVSADEDYRQRFIREADLAATLWHPNIVRVNDRGEFDGQLWIAMDFVDGMDAARLLATRYPAGMPLDQVAAIVAAVADALDYAHQRGLLHRDIKPANILVANTDGDEQRILLGDFGIARSIGDISGLTATNMTIGTLPYAAPEQLMDDPIDGRADQYALAATAYHLLTGSPLFPQSNPAVVIGRHLNTPPPALADTHPELAALDPVLAVALAKDPADRFTRCTDFARAFARAAQPHQTAAAAPTMQAPIASRTPASTAVPPTISAGHPFIQQPPTQQAPTQEAPVAAGQRGVTNQDVASPGGANRHNFAPAPSRWLNRQAVAIIVPILLFVVAGMVFSVVAKNRGSSDGDAASSSTATSPTSTSSTTTMTTTAGAPSFAGGPNTGTSSDVSTLASNLSKGYGLNNCTAQPITGSQLAALTCGQSPDPNGPAQAKYFLFSSGDDLANWFKNSIKDDVLTTCGDSSTKGPAPWHQGNATTNAGQVACGTYQDGAEIIWTTDAKNMLSYIRASNADVPALYQWWRTNG